MRRICDGYAELLLANGFGEPGAGEYAFGRMANGAPIDEYVRRVYLPPSSPPTKVTTSTRRSPGPGGGRCAVCLDERITPGGR